MGLLLADTSEQKAQLCCDMRITEVASEYSCHDDIDQCFSMFLICWMMLMLMFDTKRYCFIELLPRY